MVKNALPVLVHAFLAHLKKKKTRNMIRELTAQWSLNSRGASGQHWNLTSFLLMQFLFLDVNASCAFLKVIKGNEDTF